MSRRACWIALPAIAAAVAVSHLGAGSAPTERNGAERPTKPLVIWAGAQSQIAQREYQLITKAEDWAKLWARHTGKPVAEPGASPPKLEGATEFIPEVDFEHCAVVAIFQGDGYNSDGVSFESGHWDGDRLTIRFDEWTYQTSSLSGQADPGVRARAFAFFVVPKTAKAVYLEENTQHLIGHAPIWKERARLFLAPQP